MNKYKHDKINLNYKYSPNNLIITGKMAIS